MGKLWNRTPGADGKAQLNEVDLKAVTIDSPTIVYLSGFLTNNNQPGYIAGGIKKMEEMLGSRTEIEVQPKLFAWSHTSLKNLFNLAAYNMFPSTRSSDAGFDLGASLLMPLVAEGFTRDAKTTSLARPCPPKWRAKICATSPCSAIARAASSRRKHSTRR